MRLGWPDRGHTRLALQLRLLPASCRGRRFGGRRNRGRTCLRSRGASGRLPRAIRPSRSIPGTTTRRTSPCTTGSPGVTVAQAIPGVGAAHPRSSLNGAKVAVGPGGAGGSRAPEVTGVFKVKVGDTLRFVTGGGGRRRADEVWLRDRWWGRSRLHGEAAVADHSVRGPCLRRTTRRSQGRAVAMAQVLVVTRLAPWQARRASTCKAAWEPFRTAVLHPTARRQITTAEASPITATSTNTSLDSSFPLRPPRWERP